jgi:hypothetical protein
MHLLQGLQRVLGVGLLPHAHDRVDDQDQQDDGGLHERLHGSATVLGLFEEGQEERQSGRSKQNLDELIVELLEDQLPEGGLLFLFELVAPKLFLPGRHLRITESFFQAHFLLFQDLLHAHLEGLRHGGWSPVLRPPVPRGSVRGGTLVLP